MKEREEKRMARGGDDRFGDDNNRGGGRYGSDDRGNNDSRGGGRYGDDRGGGDRFGGRDDRGGGDRFGGRDDRGGGDRFGGRDDRGGGDRFGGRDDRGGGDRFGGRDDRGGGSRFGGRDDRGGGSRFGNNRSGGRFGGDDFSSLEASKTTTDLTAPELPKHLQPKKKPEPVLPPVQAPLTLPGEDEAAAAARIAKKKKEAQEKKEAEAKAKVDAVAKAAEDAKVQAEAAEKAEEAEEKLLLEFVSGNKQGNDLSQWCSDQGVLLPSTEKLVFALLTQTEKVNPNPECPWAEPDKYGTALLSLVKDNVLGQMQVLWGIQKYCDSIGFPKLNDGYVVQTMFRAMYKHDLAEDDAFAEWKEDESSEHEVGKMKTIIQTMDWFNWLEEDEEESEEEGYDE